MQFDGEIRALRASAILHGNNVTYRDIRLGDLKADLRLQNVGFRVHPIDLPFESLNAVFQISSGRIKLEDLAGKLGKGTFQLGGQVQIEKWRPQHIELKLTGQGIPILIPETLDAAVNLDIASSGRLDDLVVEGQLILVEGLYYKDFSLIQTISDQKQTTAPPPSQQDPTFLDSLRYNIQIKYRDPFVVENNIAYLEIHPDLVLSGRIDDPVIN